VGVLLIWGRHTGMSDEHNGKRSDNKGCQLN
jgi:hypothetical protein